MPDVSRRPRPAGAAEAGEVARLLHDFNVEFATPTPGVAVLTRRLRGLLGGEATLAILVGSPAIAVALTTLRPNVWYDGSVALLDELYVVSSLRNQGIGSSIIEYLEAECLARGAELIEINVDQADTDTQRFYERHGYAGFEATTGERAFYYSKEIDSALG